MEVIIRVILMFFFIQFLVLITVMAVSLLLVRHEVPVLGREPGQRGTWTKFRICHPPATSYSPFSGTSCAINALAQRLWQWPLVRKLSTCWGAISPLQRLGLAISGGKTRGLKCEV